MERRGGCCVIGSHAQDIHARVKVPVTTPLGKFRREFGLAESLGRRYDGRGGLTHRNRATFTPPNCGCRFTGKRVVEPRGIEPLTS